MPRKKGLGRGWWFESERHRLARMGIKTGRKQKIQLQIVPRGWKKLRFGLTHWGNRKIKQSITYVYKSGKAQIDIFLNPYNKMWQVDIWRHPSYTKTKKFKTKTQALKFAKEYIEKH